MEGFDRRKFLKGSSVAVGMAGAMTVLPGAIPALAKSSRGAASGSASGSAPNHQEDDGQSFDTDEAVVVHVRDAKEGQIDLFIGTRHLAVQDRALTNRIMSATR